MRWRICRYELACFLVLIVARCAQAEVTDDRVRAAIQRGVTLLKSQQTNDGSWSKSEITRYLGGVTSLCTLALISAGEEVTSPPIQKALGYLRSLDPPKMVYSASLQTMVFCAAEPDKDAPLIRRNVDWLASVQISTGARQGAWAYSEALGGGDNSNTQFALLALHEAERAGVTVQRVVWQRGLDYWLRTQKRDGSWGYYDGEPSTGSMTCAGITSLIICAGRIRPGDAQVADGKVQCCSSQTDDAKLQAALRWMGSKFSVTRNPSPPQLGQHYLYYYLYGLERVGRLTGQRFLDRHDWYREGAEMLVSQQDELRGLWRGTATAENYPLVATSFALLFLSKGRRPVVIAKLKYGSEQGWDLHRSAIANLTRRVEQRWRRDLTWQTIDLQAATAEDLLETPVLYLSGREKLKLSREQKENLRRYVNQGGFIFAEACCEGRAFDQDFRALAQELFPDSPLRLLPPEHPVWYAEEKVSPDYMRPLYGIDACCRTSIVYCPQDLSCYWELSRGLRETEYPKAVQDEIEACLRTGENVITYATNRELKNKLDRPQLALDQRTGDRLERGVLCIPKLLHSGGGDDAPNALPHLLSFLETQAQLRVAIGNRLITVTDESLYEYPILFMHGRRAFRFSPAERKALATYLGRGGILFADAICASMEFANSFRGEMEAIFPDRELERIPTDNPLFTRQFRGFELSSLTLRSPQIRAADDPLSAQLVKTAPLLEALKIDDRLAVIFSPYDISCALESGASLQCKGYVKEDAAKLAINVILFALQQ